MYWHGCIMTTNAHNKFPVSAINCKLINGKVNLSSMSKMSKYLTNGSIKSQLEQREQNE